LTGRNEKLDGRDQIFEDLRANSRAICRKSSEIWADQAILQSVYVKSDSLLEEAVGLFAFATRIYAEIAVAMKDGLHS
jgi:hypothetical protein